MPDRINLVVESNDKSNDLRIEREQIKKYLKSNKEPIRSLKIMESLDVQHK